MFFEFGWVLYLGVSMFCSWLLNSAGSLFSVLFLLLIFLTNLLVPVVRWFSVLFLYCVLVPVPVSAGLLVRLSLRDAAAALAFFYFLPRSST